MELDFTTVDVFTTTPFRGNPLAVVRVPASVSNRLTEEQKQRIALEFNLSEITFLHDVQPGQDFADYDIFTPRSRMSFAGHPTIGTAIYVAKNAAQYASVKKIRTVAGMVPFLWDESKGTVEVSIPQDVYVHKNRLPHPFPNKEGNPTDSDTVPIVSIVKGMAFCMISVKTLETLAKADIGMLIPVADAYKHEQLDQGSGWDIGYTGTFFFCDQGVDPEDKNRRLVRTRSLGTREDPGTGSASAALASYLALQESKEKSEGPFLFHLVQGVEMGRRCDIFVQVKRTSDGTGIVDVKLSGNAVKVMEGKVYVAEG
jgi:PhzF family phenazine biosynthesis protein